MQIPPRRAEPGPPTGASLPDEDRWSCHRPGQTPEIPEYCHIRHRSPETAARHSEKLNESLPAQFPGLESFYQPRRLHRIERYAVEELRYRGWTDHLVHALLGEPDARDEGRVYVYSESLFDADRVHRAEITPAFDRGAARAHNRAEPTTPEEDIAPRMTAYRQELHLHLPSVLEEALVRYARDDIQRMADARARREGLRRETRNTPRRECLQHAADRCANRSKPANAFFRRHRRGYHGHEAARIISGRLAEAAAALMPFLTEYLERHLHAVRIRPETGAEVFWGRGPRIQHGHRPLPEKLHNLTGLRWARYLASPPSGSMPPLGTVTVTTADASLPEPHVHVHPAPAVSR